MYNICMKKIFVLILVMLIGFGLQLPSESAVFAKQKEYITQKKIYKNTIKEIKAFMEKQDKAANEHNLEALRALYSKDYINSDGFNLDTAFKMVEDTWETYPDISYKTEVKHIEFTDNYATVLTQETAISTPKEKFGDMEVIGELKSTSKCVYYLQKQGDNWLISSERVIDEISSLKFGEARYIDMELNVPKQIGSGKSYTATLKVDAPNDVYMVGSINQEKIVYPQTKSDDAFRRVYDNMLERVFYTNTDSVNESIVASVGFTHAQNYNTDKIRFYLSGLAFIMTRVNVIPENCKRSK